MKTNRIATLLVLTILALSATACNNPLLAANSAEGASEFSAEVEAQVQAALAEAEASGALSSVAEVEPDSEAEEIDEVQVEPEVEPEATAEPTPEIEVCTDRAEFITDVTVPDGADFTPGQAFVKTWRLRNAGTCTWTSSYDLVFDHGDAMAGPASKQLAGLVHPGATLDLSADLTAPGTEGGYKGYWLLRNSDGVLFGIGANANVAFWVEIEVLEEDDDDFIVFELAPLQLFPIYTSNGAGQSLTNGACFDLDAGNLVGCGSASADFRYNAEFQMDGFPPTLKLVSEAQPRHGASFDHFGNDIPTGVECQGAGLSTSTFDLQSKVYCYQTDVGSYGYLKVSSGDMFSMIFDWGTYIYP